MKLTKDRRKNTALKVKLFSTRTSSIQILANVLNICHLIHIYDIHPSQLTIQKKIDVQFMF